MGRGKSPKTLALIAACQEILEQLQPCSVRAVCYQLFNRKLIPSMDKNHTNAVSKQLVYAREQGMIPWDWIVDDTREAQGHAGWADLPAYIRTILWAYRRDRWQLQSQRVEVWSEKGTIGGTLSPVLRLYGVTFRVMHGYASATALYDVACLSQADPRPLTAFYLGDWDPSGLHMSEVDIPGRLSDYGARLDVQRLALTQPDTQDATLPDFAAASKVKDARYEWFVARYGTRCWELDALSPAVLRTRVESAITALIDQAAWDRCEAVEAAEQRSLREILGRLPRPGAG